MKILIAPNSFKGSLSSAEAVEAIELGVKKVDQYGETLSLLLSDGGDGFVQALEHGFDFVAHSAEVLGPLGETVDASFLYSPKTKNAIIEMAKSSGLALLEGSSARSQAQCEQDSMLASTFGFGQLILTAADLGAQHFILGIGGSATNDGGMGMAVSLGIRFFDSLGNSLTGNAENLSNISKIDVSGLDCRLSECTFDVACDVNNLLLGAQGAAQVYAPQKGASPAQVLLIENGLCNLANVIERDLGVRIVNLVGGGAAGGLGAGLFAFLGAKLKPGAELLLDMQQFERKLQDVDLVITTEGKLDSQTAFGKAPFVVAKRAKALRISTVIICGQVALTDLDVAASDFLSAHALCEKDVSISFSMLHARELLTKKTTEVVRAFMAQEHL